MPCLGVPLRETSLECRALSLGATSPRRAFPGGTGRTEDRGTFDWDFYGARMLRRDIFISLPCHDAVGDAPLSRPSACTKKNVCHRVRKNGLSLLSVYRCPSQFVFRLGGSVLRLSRERPICRFWRSALLKESSSCLCISYGENFKPRPLYYNFPHRNRTIRTYFVVQQYVPNNGAFGMPRSAFLDARDAWGRQIPTIQVHHPGGLATYIVAAIVDNISVGSKTTGAMSSLSTGESPKTASVPVLVRVPPCC